MYSELKFRRLIHYCCQLTGIHMRKHKTDLQKIRFYVYMLFLLCSRFWCASGPYFLHYLNLITCMLLFSVHSANRSYFGWIHSSMSVSFAHFIFWFRNLCIVYETMCIFWLKLLIFSLICNSVWQQCYVFISSSNLSLFGSSCHISQFSDVALWCQYPWTGWGLRTFIIWYFVFQLTV